MFSQEVAVEEEANLTACALNSRANYWTGALGCEASLFEYWECPSFYDHWCKIGMVSLLLLGYDVMPVSFLGCKNSPRVNTCHIYVAIVDCVDGMIGDCLLLSARHNFLIFPKLCALAQTL